MLITLVLVAYGSAINNGFVLDDQAIVLRHPLVVDPQNSWRAFVEPYWPEALGGGQYRPLGLISFAVDRFIAGESNVWYHAVNLAWHAAVVCLLFFWLSLFLPVTAAILASAVFAVHPVHVEAVANIVGRLELMAAAFLLAALLAHERKSWLAPLLYLCALFSKEHAVIFIGVAAITHFLGSNPRHAVQERSRLWVAYSVITIAWLGLMTVAVKSHPAVISAVFQGLTVPERLLTVLSIVPEYARLLLFPFHLSSDYELNVLQPAKGVTLQVALGVLIVVLSIVVGVLAWKKDRAITFALALFAVSVAPVSNVLFPTGVALAERTLYFPSIAASVVIGQLLTKYSAGRGLASVVTVLILCGGLVRTWTRVPVWRDPRTHVMTLLEEHPESYMGHWVAARVLASMGNIEGAQREFGLAQLIFPNNERLNQEAVQLKRVTEQDSAAQPLSVVDGGEVKR